MTITSARSESIADAQRAQHVESAQSFFIQAKLMAEAGSFREAGILILQGLDQERRAQSTGPQVLQLIKPRT